MDMFFCCFTRSRSLSNRRLGAPPSLLHTGPKTAGAASRACNKTANCGNPGFIRNVMQEQYPELEVYQCEGGKLQRYADYWAAV